MPLRYLPVLLLTILFSCKKTESSLPEEISYANPLLPSGADPWVIQADSFYYYTNTIGNKIVLWRTKHMSRLGSAYSKRVWTPPASGLNAYHLWASELHRINGKWYIYYTAGETLRTDNQHLFVLENSTDDPLSDNWVDKGKICDPQADFFAIDPTVFTYKGNNYFIWAGIEFDGDRNLNLYISRLNKPWSLATPRIKISKPDHDWERVGSLPGGGVNEGPEILVNKYGRVFLIYSASTCFTNNYSLGMIALRENGDPLNPAHWEKYDKPVFETDYESPAISPGHNAFFKSPDGKEDWILYHAKSKPSGECNDLRNPRIQKFTWNADGTPHFGRPVPTNVRLPRPSGEIK